MPNTIGTAYVQIEPTTKGISGSLSNILGDEAEKAGSSAGGKLSSALGAAAKIGVTAIAGATAAVGAFGKSAVDAGMTFDASMSQVAATMGVSVDSIEELRNFAQEMGSTTAFSATQAADALNYMALAGYDADTSMKMLPSVLNLAAAGGIDLATASDMVTDAQSALGLSLDETSLMVDRMARTSSKSNTSVAQLGEAFLTVGGTAKNLSGGTKELSTALGILANNGVKGAEGGTALRNIILSLSAPTDKAAGAMKALGVQAFDANGELKPLNVIFGDLNNALSTMTQEEKTQALNNIFNKVDLKSVDAMLSGTARDLSGLQEALASVSVEWSRYDNGVTNSADVMKGVFSDAMYNMNTGLLRSTEGIQEFCDYLVSEYNMSMEEASEYTKTFVENQPGYNVANTWNDLKDSITGAWFTMDSLKESMANNGISFEQMQSNLESLGIATDDIEKSFGWAKGNVDDFVQSLWECTDGTVTEQMMMEALGGDLDALQKAFDETSGSAQAMADTQLDNLAGDITLFQSALEGAKIAVSDSLTPALRDFVQIGSQGLSDITEGFKSGGLDGAMKALGETISSLVKKVIEEAPKMVKAAMELLKALGKGIIENLPLLIKSALEIVLEIANGIAESLPELIPTIVDVVLEIVETLIDNVDMLVDASIAIIVGLAEGLIDALPRLLEKGPVIISKLVEAIIKNLPKLISAALQIIITLADGLIKNLPRLVTQIPTLIKAIVNGLKDGVKDILAVGGDLVSGLWKGIKDSWKRLVEDVKGLGKELVDSVKRTLKIGSPSKVFRDEVGQWIPEGIAVGIEASADSVQDALSDVTSDAVISANNFGKDIAPELDIERENGSDMSGIVEQIGSRIESALMNMGVYMDGRAVGNLVAAPVNDALGRMNVRRV